MHLLIFTSLDYYMISLLPFHHEFRLWIINVLEIEICTRDMHGMTLFC
jgi:hypothetical protein